MRTTNAPVLLLLLLVLLVFTTTATASSWADDHEFNLKELHHPHHHHRTAYTGGHGCTAAAAYRVSRAYERASPRLLMPMIDRQTMLVYHSQLPMGGIFKGRRGFELFTERLYATAHVHSVTCNITAIDEARGTAMLDCVRSLTFKTTGRNVSARAIVAFKLATTRTLDVLNIVDLDYVKMMEAFRTRPEQLLHLLALTVARYGPTSNESQKLWADNITISYATPCNKHVLRTHSKSEFNKLMNDKDAGFLFMAWLERRMVSMETLLPLDDNRVVTLESLGDIRKQTRRFARAPEGIYQSGVGGMDVLMKYTLWEFNDQGLLASVHSLLNRPLTAIDLMRLRKEDGITLAKKYDS